MVLGRYPKNYKQAGGVTNLPINLTNLPANTNLPTNLPTHVYLVTSFLTYLTPYLPGIIPLLDLAQRQCGGWIPLAAMDKVCVCVCLDVFPSAFCSSLPIFFAEVE
jgi:hypothetical protein